MAVAVRPMTRDDAEHCCSAQTWMPPGSPSIMSCSATSSVLTESRSPPCRATSRRTSFCPSSAFFLSFCPSSARQQPAQIQYTIDNGAVSEKPVFYDYLNLHYRADGYLLNNAPFATQNLSSYWLGNDLYIYTFDINNCVHLNLGFGMMRPDWFMSDNATIFGEVYATQRSDSARNVYRPVTLTRKDGAGQGYFGECLSVNGRM